MIDPKELRVGNWIMTSADAGPQKVGLVWEDFVKYKYSYPHKDELIDEYNPRGIPLTEEWLLKFGFEKIEGVGGNTAYKKEYVVIFQHNQDLFSLYNYNDRKVYIKYIHRLQNLYFALTGEELTIE